MSKNRIRFTITSGNLETAHSCDCHKWIRHLAANGIKTDDLQALFNGRYPSSRMFTLDMLEFLRKSDDVLDRFLKKRGGIQQDDHLSMEFDAVRQLLKNEFPELAANIADTAGSRKVIKRRPGTVDLSPLKSTGKKDI